MVLVLTSGQPQLPLLCRSLVNQGGNPTKLLGHEANQTGLRTLMHGVNPVHDPVKHPPARATAPTSMP